MRNTAKIGSSVLLAAAALYITFAFSKSQIPAPRISQNAPDLPGKLTLSSPGTKETPTLPEQTGLLPTETALQQQIQGRFATGDFVNALHLADQAMTTGAASERFNFWLRAQLPVLLISAGWSRLKFGDCDEATEFLRRAEVLGRTPETTKGLAVCYYKLHSLAAAREQFQAYLEKSPNDAEMQLIYSDVLESDGRFDEAVQILEALVHSKSAGIDQEALQQRLTTMRGRAKEGPMQQVETSPNFRLTYRAGEHEDLVSFVLTTLEDAVDEYIETRGMRPPPAPIEVALYPDSSFRTVAGGPEWAEGLFDGRLRIPVHPGTLAGGDYRNLKIVLRHELVHALLSLMSGGRSLPPWFDEGVAQRISCAGSPCAQFEFGASSGGFLAPQAFVSPYLALSRLNAGRAYKQSLYLILTLEQLRRDEGLRRVVQSINPAADLSADALLAPLALTFNGLVAEASTLWAQTLVPR